MKLKVWGGLVSCPRRGDFEGCSRVQHRAIVRARSQKRALELLREAGHSTSANELRNYWSLTGNPVEMIVVAEDYEGVWISLGDGTGSRSTDDYRKIL